MKCVRILLTLLLLGVLSCLTAFAQPPNRPKSCGNNEIILVPADDGIGQCAPGVQTLAPGAFQATPFTDAVCQRMNGHFVCPTYGNSGPDQQIVSLYGTYGNDENFFGNNGMASTHYSQGVTLASRIVPRCTDGSTVPTGSLCSMDHNRPPAIVFLFLGLSNCTIEVCGGNSDAFDNDPSRMGTHLNGQPCATGCPNPTDINGANSWNVSPNGDPTVQKSFLQQVYDPTSRKVGPSVVIFDGAKGQRTLDHWDPTSIGYWAARNDCENPLAAMDPECEYDRVGHDLQFNGFSEAQVQAVFLRTADASPQCALDSNYCDTKYAPDVYQQEQYLGDILRYLKCCKLNSVGPIGIPRYPNLQQVFITSETYGGYANGQGTINGQEQMFTDCLLEEPFAYEGGFAVQRTILAQINRAADQHTTVTGTLGTGSLNYTPDANGNNIGDAPWFDWGPYLWISGETQRQSDLRRWCGAQTSQFCNPSIADVRIGDLGDTYGNEDSEPGDFTHPSAHGLEQVADQLVNFVQSTTLLYIKNWIGQ